MIEQSFIVVLDAYFSDMESLTLVGNQMWPASHRPDNHQTIDPVVYQPQSFIDRSQRNSNWRLPDTGIKGI